VITTFAGSASAEAGFSGDGGRATRARLNRPTALAMDRMGRLYIADTGNHCVRRVDPRGIISTVAGNAAACDGRGTPRPGYDGDGGPATRARLNRPSGLAVGERGELYIADTDNLRIRKVDTRGVISTVAGNGVATITPSGDVIHAFCGDYSRARSARLNRPMGIALDSFGNLFIADSGNHRVRMVKWDGSIVTVVGGGEPPDRIGDGLKAPDARLDTPTSVALDGDGNLYVADPLHHRVRKVHGIAGPGLSCGRPLPRLMRQ
jgi:sugar lactone lactonase YvrE